MIAYFDIGQVFSLTTYV